MVLASPTSAGSTSSPFPKWQLAAIALGATGAVGLGYWYMKRHSKTNAINLTEKHEFKGKLNDLKKQSTSVDDTVQSVSASEPQTPLDQALKHKSDGNTHFKNGLYDKAIACYTQAIDVCPPEHSDELATFYQNRAAAYEHLKKYSSIIDDCTKALESKRNYVKALMRRARAYEAIKNWSDCLDDISAVCLLQGFQEQSSLIMADRVLKELGRKHASEAIAARVPITPSSQFIKTYFSSFSSDPVYNQIISITNGDDHHDDTNDLEEESTKGFARARIAFLNEKYDEIIPACSEEIDSSESESEFKSEALSLRGTFHLLRGSYIQALDDLASVIDNEQVDVNIRVNALIKRASLYMQLEKSNECMADFDLATELGPNVSDVYHHRGQMNLLTDRIDEASRDFDRAVELNPSHPIAYVQKCYTDYRQAIGAQDLSAANDCMARFGSAVEKFPKCLECYILYAQVLTEQHCYDKANEYYEKALKMEPNNATIYVHKSLLTLQWTGDANRAISLMNTAIEKDPLCEFAFETFATVEVQRGNLTNAISLFDKAIKLAKTELEMVHLFSLRDAAMSQQRIAKKLGISLPSIPM